LDLCVNITSNFLPFRILTIHYNYLHFSYRKSFQYRQGHLQRGAKLDWVKHSRFSKNVFLLVTVQDRDIVTKSCERNL